MFRVLTVAREYGSGGARIAQIVATRLSWRLLDNALITELGQKLKVNPELLSKYDEIVDPWLHRLSRRALWYGGFQSVSVVPSTEFLDADTMARLARELINEAYDAGNCVIVGRGGQCVLQDRRDVFHVFVYAPWRARVSRIRQRVAGANEAEHLIRATDEQRTAYTRLHYGCEWRDPHLYHMLVSSEVGDEAVASLIIAGMGVNATAPPSAAHG